jgi:hypothetical protein
MRILFQISCPFCGLKVGADRVMPDKSVRMLKDVVGECAGAIGEISNEVVSNTMDHIRECAAKVNH